MLRTTGSSKSSGCGNLVGWVQVNDPRVAAQQAQILLHSVAVRRLAGPWGSNDNLTVQGHGGVRVCLLSMEDYVQEQGLHLLLSISIFKVRCDVNGGIVFGCRCDADDAYGRPFHPSRSNYLAL